MTAASSRARNGLLLMESSSSMRNLMTYDPNSSQAKVEDRDEREGLECDDAATAETLGVTERAGSGRDQIVCGGGVGRQAGDAEAGGDRALGEAVRRDDTADALGVGDGARLGRIGEQRRDPLALGAG